MSLRTEYEFVLPRGYVDDSGAVHKHGIMRLATARDELEPLRDPTISSPDDPRLTGLQAVEPPSRSCRPVLDDSLSHRGLVAGGYVPRVPPALGPRSAARSRAR